jgi:molecular chaperone HscC
MYDKQTQILVDIYQGEAPKVEDNVFLGKFLVDVPKNRAGVEGMSVRITYDPSGLIEVEGRSLTTGRAVGTVIRQNAASLDEAEIAARLRAMAKLKFHPREQEENTAFIARLRRVYEMANGDDRHVLQGMLMTFEAAITSQNLSVIDRLRGDMTRALEKVDDYYAS